MNSKKSIDDLAILGAFPLFSEPISTSNLVCPDIEDFLRYSRVFFEKKQYTNNGPLVRMLEERLAALHQAAYCVTFCSGFWGLVLAISSLALHGKKEVVMPSLTYRRMADVVAWTKLVPHFCDISSETLSMTAETAKQAINSDTALILAVHPIVNCCDVDALVALAKQRNIPILFDAVESAYESVCSGKVGQFGDAELFSMHASKLINGFEGGYLTTNNPELAEKLALRRGFGFKGQDHIAVDGGLNAKLNEIHAAMALAGLDDLEAQVERNKRRYKKYRQSLGGIPGVRLLEFDEKNQTSFKNIVIELSEEWPMSRDDTVNILNAEGILARAYYSPPLHQKEMAYPHTSEQLPLTEKYSLRMLLLPCGHFVDEADIVAVCTFMVFLASNGDAISKQLNSRAEALGST